MRMKLRTFGICYLLTGLLALWIKFRYGHAGCGELSWLLAPVAAWAGRLGSLSFVYEPEVGYLNHSARFIIAPSCSGVQFLLIAFLMLVFTFVHRMGTWKRGLTWTAFSLAVSYGYTVFVNGIRIVLAIRVPALLNRTNVLPSWLTPERLHTLIGVTVYFLALLLLYQITDTVLTRLEPSLTVSVPDRAAGKYLLPAFWYLFVVLGIPFLNRALSKDREAYLEYACLTGGACLALLIIILLFRKIICRPARALRRLRPHAHFHESK